FICSKLDPYYSVQAARDRQRKESTMSSRIPGFKDFSIEERHNEIVSQTQLSADDLVAYSASGGLSVVQANHMVENVIGTMGIPTGIATNLIVNGRDVLVPMATEEPSVIAAASNLPRVARPHGGVAASSSPPHMRAQVRGLAQV